MTQLLSSRGVDISQRNFQQIIIRGDGKDQFNQIINKEISMLPPSKNLEVIKDDKDSLKSFLSEALEVSDVIISSGGVSMGRYDYVRDVFIELGVKEHFWKVAQKPGKPLFFGTKEKSFDFIDSVSGKTHRVSFKPEKNGEFRIAKLGPYFKEKKPSIGDELHIVKADIVSWKDSFFISIHSKNDRYFSMPDEMDNLYSNKKDQITSFLEHIEASKQTNLPLIIHTRNAEDETLEILKKAKKKADLKILIHCFTGTRDFAFKLIDLGAYISASGVITFKKSMELAKTFKELPNNRILVETDSPYLAPEPLRGKPNEPSYIIHTVKFLSKLKNISFEDFSKITTKNFFKLFGELN